jgi:hypothetical protein
MVTPLKVRLAKEFGDLMTESSIDNHAIPVVIEWLLEHRIRKVGQDYNRRTSHDKMIDDLVKELKLDKLAQDLARN